MPTCYTFTKSLILKQGLFCSSDRLCNERVSVENVPVEEFIRLAADKLCNGKFEFSQVDKETFI